MPTHVNDIPYGHHANHSPMSLFDVIKPNFGRSPPAVLFCHWYLIKEVLDQQYTLFVSAWHLNIHVCPLQT